MPGKLGKLMFKSLEKMTHDPNEMIISRADDIGLFYLFRTVSLSYSGLMLLQLLFVLVVPANLLSVPIGNEIVSFWRDMSPNVRDTYSYLESARAGLGYKYAFSYGACIITSGIYTLICLLIAAYTDPRKLNKLSAAQITSFKVVMVFLLVFFCIGFYADFTPYNPQNMTRLKSLFSTEWAIITINIVIFLFSVFLVVAIFTVAKYIKIKGNRHV